MITWQPRLRALVSCTAIHRWRFKGACDPGIPVMKPVFSLEQLCIQKKHRRPGACSIADLFTILLAILMSFMIIVNLSL